MSKKILLHLLILCGVLCQGIIATSSNDDIQESSALLAREKRVVNLGPDAVHQHVRIQEVNYMTFITQYNRANCIGVILSHYTVITAANCVLLDKSIYRLNSGSSYPSTTENHTISSIESYYGNPPHDANDGIALLTVDPPFTFGPKTGPIELYEGPLLAGTEVSVSGWGSQYELIPAAAVRGLPRRLRQIILPIMNHDECRNVYQSHFRVTNKHICTYHIEKYCARTDAGAPLVINQRLAGIHVFKGKFLHQINPDLFVDLRLPEYSEWIRRNAILM